MPNPPYTTVMILLEEGPDGIAASVLAWDDLVGGNPSQEEHPRVQAIIETLKKMTPKPTFSVKRNFATKAALSTGFNQLRDQRFPDSP